MIQAATTQITKRATALDVHEVPETRFVAISLYFADSRACARGVCGYARCAGLQQSRRVG
jgi:hypothetical protein